MDFFSDFRPGKMGVIVENKTLQSGMARETFEPILLHFHKSLIGCPVVVCHAIHSCHDAGSMTSSLTMDVYGLHRWIIYQFQKSCNRCIRRPVGSRERDSIEVHSFMLD